MADPIYGISFPFRFGPDGRVATSDGDAKLRENVTQILLTTVGERIMRRDYGGGLRQILHDPNNDALRAIVQHQVAKALATLEPRISVIDIVVAQDEATIAVSVSYAVRRTRQLQQLTVPIAIHAT
jgi:uncharacterized protein